MSLKFKAKDQWHKSHKQRKIWKYSEKWSHGNPLEDKEKKVKFHSNGEQSTPLFLPNANVKFNTNPQFSVKNHPCMVGPFSPAHHMETHWDSGGPTFGYGPDGCSCAREISCILSKFIKEGIRKIHTSQQFYRKINMKKNKALRSKLHSQFFAAHFSKKRRG